MKVINEKQMRGMKEEDRPKKDSRICILNPYVCAYDDMVLCCANCWFLELRLSLTVTLS